MIVRGAIATYDQPPSGIVLEEMAALRREFERHLAEFNDFLKTDMTSFNKMVLEKGANALFAGGTIELNGGTAEAAAATPKGGGTSSDLM